MTLADLTAAAETISRVDAYGRVELVRSEEEAAALYRNALASDDIDLIRALTDAALWNDWNLEVDDGSGVTHGW